MLAHGRLVLVLRISVALIEGSAQRLLFVAVRILSTGHIVIFEEDLIVLLMRDELR